MKLTKIVVHMDSGAEFCTAYENQKLLNKT